MSKTPYEIRLELLKLSTNLLIDRFQNQMRLLDNKLSYSEYKPDRDKIYEQMKTLEEQFPSIETITKTANTFKEFIDNS